MRRGHFRLQSASLSHERVVQPGHRRDQLAGRQSQQTAQTDLYLIRVPKRVWLLDYLHFTGERIANCIKNKKSSDTLASVCIRICE